MTFDRYEEILAPGTHHLSTIPNTPVAVCEGIVVCERRHSLSEAEWQSVQALLSHVGLVVTVDTAQLGIAGTVCGCGPAFVAMFIEALADAAVKHGVVRADAYRMASQMVVGTGKLQLRHGAASRRDEGCRSVRPAVRPSSVGGAGRKRFRGAVIDAIDAIQDKKIGSPGRCLLPVVACRPGTCRFPEASCRINGHQTVFYRNSALLSSGTVKKAEAPKPRPFSSMGSSRAVSHRHFAVYRTRSERPMRSTVVDLMPFRRQMFVTVVP